MNKFNNEMECNWIGRIQSMFHIGQRPSTINEVIDYLIKNDMNYKLRMSIAPKEWIRSKVVIALQTMVRKKRKYYQWIQSKRVGILYYENISDFVANPNPNRSKKKKHQVSSSNLLPMSWAHRNRKGGK